MSKYVFGAVPGVAERDTFPDRAALNQARVHGEMQAGIHGREQEGAFRIVLSGGYADDDRGDEIIYTGEGGQHPTTKRHDRDQALTRGNLALARSVDLGVPIRVIRGARHKSRHSPPEGYRYEGLFRVTTFWHERPDHGHLVYRFRLEKLERGLADTWRPPPEPSLPGGNQAPGRRQVTTVRTVRDTKVARQIKELYNFECQICGFTIETPSGRYAEAAHIQPLGRPHNGPDVPGNVLSLCPNHHVMLDRGTIGLSNGLGLIGPAASASGSIALHRTHVLDTLCIEYHRSSILWPEGRA